MNYPKISVIVPVYNTEKYIHRCIDSILSQTFTDFELLLIDDGSKDNSGKICDEYAAKDSRVRVFHKENGGVSSARNLGLDKVKGEWITFCDSDDYVTNQWLKNFICNSCDKELIVESIKLVDGGNAYIAGPVEYIEGNGKDIMIALKYDSGTIGYPVNKLFRRDIIDTYCLRFKENLKLREDEEFVLRYLKYVNSGCVTNLGGYIYILPNYNIKYRKEDVFEVKLLLYKIALYISNGIYNSAMEKYHTELVQEFMFSLRCRKIKRIIPFLRTIKWNIFHKITATIIFEKVFNFIKKNTFKNKP